MNRHWVNENELQITCHRHMSRERMRAVRPCTHPIVSFYIKMSAMRVCAARYISVFVCVCAVWKVHTLLRRPIVAIVCGTNAHFFVSIFCFLFILSISSLCTHCYQEVLVLLLPTYDHDDDNETTAMRVPLKSTSKWNENLWNCKMWSTRYVFKFAYLLSSLFFAFACCQFAIACCCCVIFKLYFPLFSSSLFCFVLRFLWIPPIRLVPRHEPWRWCMEGIRRCQCLVCLKSN